MYLALDKGNTQMTDIMKPLGGPVLSDDDQMGSKSKEFQLQHLYVRFSSNVTDQHGQTLLSGFYVDWELLMGVADDTDDKNLPFSVIENAATNSGAETGAFLSMLLSPINDLDVQLELDDLPETLKVKWVDKQLKRHVDKTAKILIEEGAKMDGNETPIVEQTPTLLLCRTDNLVYMTSESMVVNPNIPTPDWFRCANYNLHKTNKDFRVLPYLAQHGSKDQVYRAVACTLHEFDMWKTLQDYGTNEVGHNHQKLWKMTVNYTCELLRNDPERTIMEIVMFKERTLMGILISGLHMEDMQRITSKLNVTLV